MTPEIDFAKLAASVIQGQINNAVAAASKGIRSVVAKVLATITKDLTKYTEAKIRKCSYVRTPIINRDHSTHIYNIYVQTRLRMRRNLVTDRTFIAGLSNRASFVIAGNAGSGKSMFMRHLFLELCKAERSKIPLFFELREINASEKKDIKEFLYYNLIGSNATITESQFLDSLKAGVFSLILDGFDEINHKDRKEIETQIIKLREQCPDLQIIVSSRPDADRRLESWEAFDTVYVEPLEEPQATELIDKLEYDAKIKEKFLKEAKSRLFVTHKTFLSNPLLCIMMLVTFEQTGHIPTKRHVFYEKAFDALFSIHDAAKEGVYKRKTYSNLSVDEFRNCMSAFCMVTYLQELFIFTKSQFRAALQKALELERLEINIDDLTSDMIESTCLIQIEGTDYAFTHRSFQEYFAALFISRSPAVGAKALLDSIARRNTDDVISMAFAINRGLIEREWIIPTLERVSNSATAQALQNDPVAFVEEHVGTILMQIQPNGLPTINLGWVGPRVALLTIGGLYENEILNIALSSLVATRKDQEEANAYYNRMVLKHDERLKRLGKSRYLVLSLQDLAGC
ncbi:NACHT domain-containing protein [Bradyrhizobium sp. ORS 86]|uniref:NACHT domain-containing protein n=1 Tax=Bradyrhizobium sp. ORS 86 TaxID=1685970 RepID=UPI00388E0907